MTATERSGRIVTFYSYKGGTGRSMALANVAWILASQNQRVLAVDWDLEAPGLHRYFQPFINDSELTDSPGIIDFLAAFVDGAHSERARQSPRWFESYTDTEPFTFSLDWTFPGKGTLDLIPAGQQGAAYAPRVTDFEWRKFYEVLGGGTFLQAVKARWRAEYDWVLIDSRTGISDTSGICSVQLPDDLVVCFTLNNQSIKGASAVAASVLDQRRKPDGSAGLRIFPLVTRVEKAEHLRLSAAMDLAIASFRPFLGHLPEQERERYFGSAQIHYQAFYAYEEVLAAFGDPAGGPMLSAMEKVSSIITDGTIARLGAMAESDRIEGLSRFLRRTKDSEPERVAAQPEQPKALDAAWALPPLERRHDSSEGLSMEPLPRRAPPATASFVPSGAASRSSGPAYKFWFYLSYAPSNWDAYLERFYNDLSEQVQRLVGADHDAVAFTNRSIDMGERWNPELLESIASSRVCVCVYSPAYFRSAWCGKEFNLFSFRSRQSPTPGASIMPVLWIPTEITGSAAELQFAVGSDESYRRGGLRQMLQQRRRGGGYQEWLSEFAIRLVASGTRNPLPTANLSMSDFEQVPSAFKAQTPAPDARARTVTFLFIAPTRDEAVEGRLGEAANYSSRARDWRPFGQVAIDVIAEGVAIENDLVVSAFYDNLTSGPVGAVAELIRQAEQEASPVVLIVDVKALAMPRYQGLLQALERYRFSNLATLVVTAAGLDSAALAELSNTFSRSNPESLLAMVHSDEELRERLHRSLAALKALILSVAAAPASPFSVLSPATLKPT